MWQICCCLPSLPGGVPSESPVVEGGVQSQGPELGDELGGDYGVEC